MLGRACDGVKHWGYRGCSHAGGWGGNRDPDPSRPEAPSGPALHVSGSIKARLRALVSSRLRSQREAILDDASVVGHNSGFARSVFATSAWDMRANALPADRGAF